MTKESSSFWADIKKYEDILVNDPNSYCFTILSELYRRLGLHDEAINTANRGIGIHPDYVGGHMAAGRAYFEKGMYQESKIALERVARVTPDNLLAQKLLIRIYIEEGNVTEAKKILQVIELLNPGDVESRQMLESFCLNVLADDYSNNLQSTVSKDLEAVVNKDFSGFDIEDDNLDQVLLAEQIDAGLNNQDKMPDVDNAPLATVTLAELYVSQGFIDKALAVYQELLEMSPDNEEFKTRLEELQRELVGPDQETSCLESVDQEQNESADTIWESYDSAFEIPECASQVGKDAMVLSILESWLVNIDRGRYAAEGNTEKYC